MELEGSLYSNSISRVIPRFHWSSLINIQYGPDCRHVTDHIGKRLCLQHWGMPKVHVPLMNLAYMNTYFLSTQTFWASFFHDNRSLCVPLCYSLTCCSRWAQPPLSMRRHGLCQGRNGNRLRGRRLMPMVAWCWSKGIRFIGLDMRQVIVWNTATSEHRMGQWEWMADLDVPARYSTVYVYFDRSAELDSGQESR